MPTLMRRTLFWKYAAYFSGLVSVLLILSGGLAGYFAYKQSISALEDLQREKANFVAAEIESFVGRIEDALQSTVSKFGGEGPANLDYLSLELATLLRHQPSITEVRWIAANGRERLALSRVVRDDVESGRNWSGDPGFRATRTRASYAGPVYFRDETEPYVSLAISRKPGSQVLMAEVNLKFVSDLILKI